MYLVEARFYVGWRAYMWKSLNRGDIKRHKMRMRENCSTKSSYIIKERYKRRNKNREQCKRRGGLMYKMPILAQRRE